MRKSAAGHRLVKGVTFGLLAMASILFSHEESKGIFIDALGAVIAVATVIGGSAVGASTAAVALAGRLALGGAGMLAGLGGIMVDFLAAVLVEGGARRFPGRWGRPLTILCLAGVAVGGMEALLLLFIQPADKGLVVFREIGLALFGTQVVGTLLMGGLINLVDERRAAMGNYQVALATSMDGFLVVAEDGRIREVNEQACLMTGYSRQELLAMRLAQLEAALTGPEIASHAATIRSRGHARYESSWRRKDGTHVSVEISSSPAPAAIGGFFGFIRDITEHKQTESLRSRYELLFNHARDVLLFIHPEGGRILEANEAACQAYGYSRAELLGMTIYQLRAADSPAAVSEQMRMAQREGILFETRHQRRDGSCFPVEVNARLAQMGGEPVLLSVVRDITLRKEAEQALARLNRELEQRVAERTAEALELYNNAPCGYHAIDPDGLILQMNDTELGWLGLQREEVEGQLPLATLLRPASAGLFAEQFATLRAAGRQMTMEVDLRRRDGSVLPVLLTVVAVRDADGKFLKGLATVLDISRRKKVEDDLRASEALARTTFEYSSVGIAHVSVAGRWLRANPWLCGFLGYSEAELQQMTVLEVTHPEDRDRSLSLLQRVVAGRQEVVAIAKRYLNKNGHLVWGQLNASLVRDATGQPLFFVGVIEDITQRKLGEEAVLRSEEKYRLLFETCRDAILAVDMSGTVMDCNPASLRLFGFESQPSLRGKLLLELSPPWQSDGRDSSLAVQEVFAGLQAKGSHFFEWIYQRRDGTMFVAEVAMGSLELHGQRFFQGLIRDVSDRKKSLETLRKLSRAVEYSPSIILITHASGRIEYANPSLAQITGFQPDEVLGQTPRVFKSGIHPQEFYRHIWRTITAGQVWRGELCNRRKDGQIYWESAAIAPVQTEAGVITHFVAVKDDISGRKQAAEELRAAKEAADAANRAKSVFLANMSHEIRTPMNAILGFSQLLLRDPDLTSHQERQLATVVRSGEHLMNIINGILEMSRIESGRAIVNQAVFDLHSLLDDLERMFRPRAESKLLNFTVVRQPGLPKLLRSDGTKLRQIFVNLLDNALKFTDQGGVVVRIQATLETTGQWHLEAEVEDTGRGIAQAEIPRLFNPFFQTASGIQTPGGTGLGLSISREFARLMGGDLGVVSDTGKGCIFQFNIRAARVDESESALPSAPVRRRVLQLQPGQSACRVLVADDHAMQRKLLVEVLAELGFQVSQAVDGADALAQCEARHPHVVLLDQRMPVMDGCEVTRRIRASCGQDCKIISVSASVFDEDQQRAMAAGADAFLGKPIHPAELLDLIQRLTGVEYLYEAPLRADAPEKAAPEPELEGAVRRLPVALVGELREATRRADWDNIMALMDRVAALDGQCAKMLRRLADSFDYDTMQKVLTLASP